MGTTALRRLGYLVGLAALGSAWIGLALVSDRLSPYARGWLEGAKTVLVLGWLVAALRFQRAERTWRAANVSGRKARWLAKHPDSVVGR